MIKTIFDSDDFAASDRLTRFDGLQASGAHPMRVRAEQPTRFRAAVRGVDLGAVDLVEVSSTPAKIVRTDELIMEDDPGLVAVLVPLRGRVDLVHQDRCASLWRGDLALYDSSHPFDIDLPERATLLRAQVSKGLLPIDRMEPVLGVRMSGHGGTPGLLADTLTRLMSDAATYRRSELTRLTPVIVDLLAALLASRLDQQVDLPGEASRRSLFLRVEDFVELHLNDPELSPTMIAAEHHISVSHLHRLFHGRGKTIAALIRERRLERVRRDLADPTLLDLPVHRIAARWGFSDHSSFSRAFRSAYDIPPGQYRQASLFPLTA